MTAGLELSEHLSGWWSPDDTGDLGVLGQYLEAAQSGESLGRDLQFQLTLSTPDVERLTDDLSTPLEVTGSVTIGGKDEQAVAVKGGVMQLVVADDTVDSRVQHMRYDLPIPEAGLHVRGFKVLTDGDLTQLWGASTTLYVTISGDGPDGPTVGRGVARISPTGFARQLSTFRITGVDKEIQRLTLLARFGIAFFGALWDDYGTVVHRSTRSKRSATPRAHRPLEVPVREEFSYRTADDVDLRLTRYRGGDRGPVVLVHGMGANPLTYTLDTVRPNLLEYLAALGFDVWIQEWRGSTSLPTASRQFNGDQVAQFDHPAAEAAIRRLTGRQDIHWVTHCVGSMTWMMSILAGWTTPASVVFSQVGAHPVGPTLTKIKVGARAPALLKAAGVKLLTTDSYDDESFGARVVDFALRFYPIPRPERCDSAVCRRLAFIYGIAVHHVEVDEATHGTMHELFGMTDLTMMSHLALCARKERLVDADGADAYLPNVERARLPMTFLSGAHNLVWVPESTARDYEWLVGALGTDGFSRVVLDDHGHQDSLMGADSYQRAFPAILQHLERAGC